MGPVRGTVRLDGTFGATGLVGLIRLHFFAGSATVRFEVTVRNPHRARHAGGRWDLGDPGSVLFEDLSIVFGLRHERASLLARCSVDSSEPAAVFTPPFEIYQDSSGGDRWDSTNHVNRERRVPVTFRGYRIRSTDGERTGQRASPILTLADAGGRELSVCVPQFWQNFPKALEASAGELVGAVVSATARRPRTSCRAENRRPTRSRFRLAPIVSAASRSTGCAVRSTCRRRLSTMPRAA